jgi:Glycosyl hydrolase catalytic core
MFRNYLRAAVSVAALTFLLSACGGSEGSTPAAAAPSGGGASPPPMASTPAAPVNVPTNSPPAAATSTPSTPPVTPVAKSAKRGVAYDLADPLDFAALSGGVSWWYNWGSQPNKMVPADYVAQYGMDYYPMLWGGNYDAAGIETFLHANPAIKYLLVLNEPNLTSQSNLTPQQAAALWPGFEAIAANTGVKIVGPQITWGTMANYADPVTWLDAFIAAYQAANAGRSPQIDYLGFHWYDYGLAAQLERLEKYGKPFWITEFANWHSQDDGAQIDSLAKQEAQMTDMVATCESRSDVFRYAWFTGRMSNDVHFTSLLSTAGQLTGLGKLYLSLPYNAQ